MCFFLRKHRPQRCSKHKGNLHFKPFGFFGVFLFRPPRSFIVNTVIEVVYTSGARHTMTTRLTGYTSATSNLIQANNAIQVHIRQAGASFSQHACRAYRTLEYFRGCPYVGEGCRGKKVQKIVFKQKPQKFGGEEWIVTLRK